MSASLLSPAPAMSHQRIDVRHLRAALEGFAAGVLTFDATLRPVFCNDRLADMLDITPPPPADPGTILDLLGQSILDADAVERVHALCVRLAASGPDNRATIELSDARRSRSLAVTVSGLRDGSTMACFEDVTAVRLAEASALERAMCDPLTGLPDRRHFADQVGSVLARHGAGPADESAATTIASIMMVDLDRFKTVNDTLGHQVGDHLLRLVAKRLRSVVRRGDLLARLGGDEFAILIAHASEPASLADLARRIVDVLGRPYLIEGQLVTTGASLGLACAPADGDDEVKLIRSADLALYEAKARGRGQFATFRPELDARALARRSLEMDLRRALAMNEFELHYQPQIDLGSGSAIGFEALLRWRHPDRGLVSPADFIPIAEEIGFIVPLGEWVLREACRQAHRWPNHVSVAVNVSPAQFDDPDRLLKAVSHALAVSGLAGHRLELEITESVLFRNETTVLDTLNRLREHGVLIAMDDFGTGYSSLSQLHSFPFDKIKIDRSFVTDRGGNVGSQDAIIRAIAALGTSLGMSTIAEGVETAGELARIRAGGCGSVQGYLFSRPVPIEEVPRLIAAFDAAPQPGPTP